MMHVHVTLSETIHHVLGILDDNPLKRWEPHFKIVGFVCRTLKKVNQESGRDEKK